MGLYRGSVIPDFVLPSDEGIHTRMFTLIGHRALHVVAFAGTSAPPAALVDQIPAGSIGIAGASTAGCLTDSEGVVRSKLGLRPDAVALVLSVDRLGRVREMQQVYEGEPLPALALPDDPPCPPPVLVVPSVIDARLRNDLRTRLDNDSIQTPDEQVVERRADLQVPQALGRLEHSLTDPVLLRNLTAAIGRSVIPQLRRCFGFRAKGFEGFRVVAYDGELGSHFPAHRPNLTEQTEQRGFALTIHLNDDYSGGALFFPEFQSHAPLAAAGDALLYSASLLHEAQAVESGRRYALVSYLH